MEGMLARNSLRVQHRKTRGIVRSIVVFAVILVVTSFGVRNVTRIVSYRMQDDSSINYKMDDWDYIFGTMNGDFADYEAVKAKLKQTKVWNRFANGERALLSALFQMKYSAGNIGRLFTKCLICIIIKN